MKRKLYILQFIGFIFTGLAGTLLHFLYEWSNYNVQFAPFSSVNESTWEHMKLLFFPLIVFALIQSRFLKKYENFWWIKLIGTAVGLISIPVLFYTYNGVFGKSPSWVNIVIFFIAAAITFILETLLFKNEVLYFTKQWIPFVIICLIGVMFISFTFNTPELPLFQDPLTGKYGIK